MRRFSGDCQSSQIDPFRRHVPLPTITQNFPLQERIACLSRRDRRGHRETFGDRDTSPYNLAVAKVAKKVFLCSKCGSVHSKWAGKCPDCGTWDTLEPFTPPTEDARKPLAAQHAAAGAFGGGFGDPMGGNGALTLDAIDAAQAPRTPTGIGELDRVLGGGIVPGAAILVGGEPGIGKSTLLLQMAGAIAGGSGLSGPSPRYAGERLGEGRDASSSPAKSKPPAPLPALSPAYRGEGQSQRPTLPTLYVTSEESASQTKMRAKRLGLDASTLLVLAETNLERITHQIVQTGVRVVVIDSIQMIYKPELGAAPGQRHAAARLLHRTCLPRQGERRRDHLCRPRHQGRHARGAEDH